MTTGFFLTEISESMVQSIVYKSILIWIIPLGVSLFFYSRAQWIAKKYIPKKGLWSREAFRQNWGDPDGMNCSMFFGLFIFFLVIFMAGSLASYFKIELDSRKIYRFDNGEILCSTDSLIFKEIEYDYVLSINSTKKTNEGVVSLKLLKIQGEDKLKTILLSIRFQEKPENTKKFIIQEIPQERFLGKFNSE